MEETIQRFIEAFYYCGGRLYNRYTRGPRSKAGDYAARYDKSCGYNRLSFKGKSYLEHRVIFAITHGYWPKMVDHINKNKLDNRVENLRDANHRRNNTVNSKLRKDNSSGYRGVINHKQAKGWVAQGSRTDGTRKHLGVFLCPREAALAYNHHAEFTYGPFATFNSVFDDVRE
jgi:hypothetical protein